MVKSNKAKQIVVDCGLEPGHQARMLYIHYFYGSHSHTMLESWVSRDAISFTGVNSKLIDSHWRNFSLNVLTLRLAANMRNFVRSVH